VNLVGTLVWQTIHEKDDNKVRNNFRSDNDSAEPRLFPNISTIDWYLGCHRGSVFHSLLL